VTAVFGHVVLAKLEVKEGSPAQGGADNHISSMAAVAAVRSATGDELFPSEADATAAAVAGFDLDLCLVDEFHAVFLCLYLWMTMDERMKEVWIALPWREQVNAPCFCSTEKTDDFQRRRHFHRHIAKRLSSGIMEDGCFVPVDFRTLKFAHVHGGLAFVFLRYCELNAVAFGQRAESLRDDRAVMNKHIIARISGNEAVPLLVVKPLDNSGFASIFAHGSKIPPSQGKWPTPRRRR
jgi:hypothetical protein